jgi:hypothetical protein
MTGFKKNISSIPGLSDSRRLPRIGKIKLGYQVKTKKKKPGCKCKENEHCFKCSRPVETDHFIVPPEVAAVYGKDPKELNIMLPINDIGSIFPTSYKLYGSGAGLKCHGDGQIAYQYDEKKKDFIESECPCPHMGNLCNPSGILMVILYEVNLGGCYFIRTGSYNSIIDINSGLEYVSHLVGRFDMIPLKLRRIKTDTHHDGKKQIHYTLQITLDANIKQINDIRNSASVVVPPTLLLPPENISGPAQPQIEVNAGKEPETIDVTPETKQEPEPESEPEPEPKPKQKKDTFANEEQEEFWKEILIQLFPVKSDESHIKQWDDYRNFLLKKATKELGKQIDYLYPDLVEWIFNNNSVLYNEYIGVKES